VAFREKQEVADAVAAEGKYRPRLFSALTGQPFRPANFLLIPTVLLE
jgi:hypothetical protein